jgi:uncharacterized protein YggE
MRPRVGVAIAGIMFSAVALLGAAACTDKTTVQVPSQQQQTGITVSGDGKATGTPDVANIQLGVSKLADTVADARSQAAASMDAMVTSMKNNGIDAKDIQTQQLSIAPEYDYSGAKQVLKGFRVTNIVSAKIRKIDDTSKIVDDAVTAGGNDAQVQGISFSIDNPDDLKAQARKDAMADARARAETLAKEAGVTLGAPITISESNVVVPIPFAAGAEAARDTVTPSTPIEPGTQDVTVTVNVTWSIK